MTGPKKLAQFSFIGFSPSIIISAKDREVEIENCREKNSKKIETRDPLTIIQQIQRSLVIDRKIPRFVGGAVGYVSYESINFWESVSSVRKELEFPHMEFGIFNDGMVFDHINNNAFYYFRGEDRSSCLDFSKKDEPRNKLSYSRPICNMSFDSFYEKVVDIKEKIVSGEIFQAVISKKYEFKMNGDLINFYEILRSINPSPYMFFLKIKNKHIIGSSPEMLFRVDDRTVETFPIAGTRPILKDKKLNKKMKKDLLLDPKERAEHLMLVDLARNDLGKICDYGSIYVSEFMKVHEFSHVQHLVSRVIGKLGKKYDAFDAFKAIFPAGTVTGAPKIRAMEIIDELEPSPRGPYAGAVGYFSYNGNADFAITIRSLKMIDDRAYIQVGAGIVADSDPSKEWDETEHKSRALIKALEMAGSEKN